MASKKKTKEQLAKELKALREKYEGKEFLLNKILDNIPQKVFVKDTDSGYLYCNRSFAQDLNIEPEEFIGKNDFDFFPRELAEKYRADDRRIMKKGKPESLEETYTKDGEEFIVHTIKTPLKDEKGKTSGIMGVFHDVTDYKRTEMEAVKWNKVLEGVNRVFKEALRCETEEELAATCLAVAEEITGSSFGYIGEVNYAGRFDTIAMSNPGWEACKMPQSDATRLITDMEIRGIWGRVLLEGASLITNDPSSHPDSTGVPKEHPQLASFLGVPLKYGGQTLGMIALANKEGGYDTYDQDAVEALSVAIVEALRSKRAEQTMARQAQEIQELSTPVIQVWEGVVITPLIGMLDSQRTEKFMERFLNKIVETKSPVALVDITGVPGVDTQTAQHIMEAISAARLLGTKVILTGVRPTIAQTLVHLGIDLAEVETRSSLAAGLKLALDILGLTIVRDAAEKTA